MTEDELRDLRQAAVDPLEVALEREVVGHVQLADARRVAAAAQVFQEQRVIELPQLVLR